MTEDSVLARNLLEFFCILNVTFPVDKIRIILIACRSNQDDSHNLKIKSGWFTLPVV